MSNYNAQKRENFPKGNNAGKSKHNSPKIDFKETYFKTTYQYLNNINEENIELDMVFNAISKFVKVECKSITTTQLRNIYAKIVNCDTVKSLKMLRPNLAYIAARQKNAKDVVMFLDQLIQDVKDDPKQDVEDNKHLISFKKVMEAIVAYHKFHHNTK